jgi:hypothetical protein
MTGNETIEEYQAIKFNDLISKDFELQLYKNCDKKFNLCLLIFKRGKRFMISFNDS